MVRCCCTQIFMGEAGWLAGSVERGMMYIGSVEDVACTNSPGRSATSKVVSPLAGSEIH